MTFWILAVAMTAAATALVLRPLLRAAPAAAPPTRPHDLAVYRDQLQELERDLARGAVDAREAAAARAEVGRRMLAAADKSDTPSAAALPSKWAAAAICMLVPLGALGAYARMGHPELPAQPFAERQVETELPPVDVAAALANLTRHVAANPGDVEAWVLLGRVNDRMDRHEESAEAYRKAVELAPADATLASSLGEALFKANRGQVTQEAQRAFETALAQDPEDPRARYYLALARFQVGDYRGALDGWADLVGRTPADAPWLSVVRERIAEAAQELGLDPATATPQPLPPAHPAG